MIPTEDGKYVALRDPVKRVITAGGGEMELRKLSEEEKASRRMRKNIVMAIGGAIVLLIAAALLKSFG